MAVEIANLAGFSQAGAPVMIRSSRAIPAREPAKTSSINSAVAVSGALSDQAFLTSWEIVRTNIWGPPLMLTASTFEYYRLNVDDVNINVRVFHGAKISLCQKETGPAVSSWKSAGSPHRRRPEADHQERSSCPHTERDRSQGRCVTHGGLPSFCEQGRFAGGDPGSGFCRVRRCPRCGPVEGRPSIRVPPEGDGAGIRSVCRRASGVLRSDVWLDGPAVAQTESGRGASVRDPGANDPRGTGGRGSLHRRRRAARASRMGRGSWHQHAAPCTRLEPEWGRQALRGAQLRDPRNGPEAEGVFLENGTEAYRKFQRGHEDELKPHLFFDDQMTHLHGAADVAPSGHVPFGINNKRPLREETFVVKLTPEVRDRPVSGQC